MAVIYFGPELDWLEVSTCMNLFNETNWYEYDTFNIVCLEELNEVCINENLKQNTPL